MKRVYLFTIVVTVWSTASWTTADKRIDRAFFVDRRGDFVLGGLFPLHRRGTNENDCGPFEIMPGYHYMEAMLYAIEKINNDTSILPNITLGARIYDTCRSQTVGTKMTKKFITMALVPPANGDQLAGVIGAHSSELSKIVADFLRVFDIPQVSYGSTATLLSDKSIYSYFFRTVSPDTWQARAMADVVVKLGWNFVMTIHSKGIYAELGMEEFHAAAKHSGICIALKRSLSSFPTDDEFDRLIRDLNREEVAQGVVLFTLQRDSRSILEALARNPSSKRFHWVASDSWGNNVDVINKGLERLAEGTITISQLNQPVVGFEHYFRSLNAKEKRLSKNEWFRYFWQSHFNCSLKGSALHFKKNCSGNESLSSSRSHFAPVQTVVNAVYAMAHALHGYVKDRCTGSNGICRAVQPIERRVLVRYLRNVSFVDQATAKLVSFNEHQETSGSYSIFSFQKSNGGYVYKNVGVWRGALELNMSELRWQNYSTVPPVSLCSKTCAHGEVRRQKGEHNITCCWDCVACASRDIIVNNTCERCPYGHYPRAATECVKFPTIDLMSKPLSKAILAVSLIGLACDVVVAIIFFKNSHVPLIKASSRELTGIILFGLALLFTFPWLLLSEPSRTICATQTVVLGVALASCYAPLFMKILRIYRIFTGARTSVNKPILVSPTSQVLIAFSLIMVQCLFGAISFFSNVPPPVEREMAHALFVECSMEKKVFASLLSYNMLLMAMCTVMAFKTRRFPRNFNEARYIGFTMYFTCFVWIIFFPPYLSSAADGLVRVNWEASAVLCIGWITLLGLFAPKLYFLFRGRVLENTDQLAVTNTSAPSEGSVMRVESTITPANIRRNIEGSKNYEKENPGSVSIC